MALLVLALHIAANMLWIGSIVAVGLLTEKGPEHARTIYLRLATPAFGASFLFGAIRVAMDPSYYLHLHWFHAKLTAALVVIALHHVIGGKAKRAAAAAGSVQAGRNGAILAVGLFVFALAVVVLVTYRTVLIP
jgi:putative membrane protein